MKRWHLLAAPIIVLLLSSTVSAQLKSDEKPMNFSQLLTQGLSAPSGLVGLIGLNPNRFSMQQSYSLSYMSLGGQGFSQGVYLNTMSYQIANPLQFSVQWGIMNNPLGTFGAPAAFQDGFFLSGANLEYKPSDKFSVGIQVNSYPTRYYGPYRSLNPYYFSPEGDK